MEAFILSFLCESFCGASASPARQRDLQQFVGDAAGSMPVCRKLKYVQIYTI